jgi:hypothetical protein
MNATAADLLVRLNLNFDDSRAIELLDRGGRYLFRYFDGQDQREVTLELDAELRVVREVREHGDDDDYAHYCGH